MQACKLRAWKRHLSCLWSANSFN